MRRPTREMRMPPPELPPPPPPLAYVEPANRPISGLGIASLLLGLFSGSWAAVLLLFYFPIGLIPSHLRSDLGGVWLVSLLVGYVFAVPVALAGLALGVGGLLARRRLKGFAWAGAALNAFALAVAVKVYVFGSVFPR